MERRWLIRIVRGVRTGACILAIAVTGLSCDSGGQGTNDNTGGTTGDEPETVEVVMDNKSFIPKTLTISRGTTVTWINKDVIPHTVVRENSPGKFDSGLMVLDQTFSHTFNTAGVFSYNCTLHPRMDGAVIVKE